jgi:tetratricopeptide (TPR) repeat protein
MSAPAQATKARRTPALLAAAAIILAGGAFAGWWFGPWNEEARYRRESLLSLHQSAEANPNDARAWRWYAIRVADTGDPIMAEPALRRAFELNPADAAVGTGLGELLLATNRVDEAFQVLKATVNHKPGFALAHMALGRLYKRQGSDLHAAEEFTAAVKADKSLSDGWYELATCNLQMQKGADARAAIAEAIKLAPEEAHYLALKSSIDAVVGATDEGIATAKKAAELAPKSARVQLNYANILLAHFRNDEDLNEAERVIDRLEKVDPTLRIIPYEKGELARRRKNWPAAELYLKQAARATPYLDEVFFSLNYVYQRLGKKNEAEAALKYYRRRQYLRQEINAVGLTITRTPTDMKNQRRLAELKLEAGDREGAVSTLRKALLINSEAIDIRKRLEQLTGRPEPAAPQANAPMPPGDSGSSAPK